MSVEDPNDSVEAFRSRFFERTGDRLSSTSVREALRPVLEEQRKRVLEEARSAIHGRVPERMDWTLSEIDTALSSIDDAPEEDDAEHRIHSAAKATRLRERAAEHCGGGARESSTTEAREYRVNAYDGIVGPFSDVQAALWELGEHQFAWEESGMKTRAPDLESRAVGPWEARPFRTASTTPEEESTDQPEEER